MQFADKKDLYIRDLHHALGKLIAHHNDKERIKKALETYHKYQEMMNNGEI